MPSSPFGCYRSGANCAIPWETDCAATPWSRATIARCCAFLIGITCTNSSASFLRCCEKIYCALQSLRWAVLVSSLFDMSRFYVPSALRLEQYIVVRANQEKQEQRSGLLLTRIRVHSSMVDLNNTIFCHSTLFSCNCLLVCLTTNSALCTFISYEMADYLSCKRDCSEYTYKRNN